MADLKISQLGSIVTVVPSTDVLPVVQGGTTYKVTPNQLLGAGGTATLASATITGAATVGTTLGVTGVSSFAAGTAALPALTRTGDTNTGIYYPAADTVAVTTGGTERLRVDSTGKVGINNLAPQGTLTINNANDDAFVLFGNNATGLTGSYGAIKASYTGNITTFGVAASLDFIRNESSDGKGGDIYFKTNSAGESGATTKVIINGVGNIKMAVADKGIDFSINSNATGATSEILNDYEEGTWTGTLKGSITDPTVAVTATGRYTKIGRQVSIDITFSNISNVGASGELSVTGLPFTCNGSVNAFGATSMNGIGTFAGGSPISIVTTGGTTLLFYGNVSGSANVVVTHNPGIAKYFNASISYSV